jgi:hypothetical protein
MISLVIHTDEDDVIDLRDAGVLVSVVYEVARCELGIVHCSVDAVTQVDGFSAPETIEAQDSDNPWKW